MSFEVIVTYPAFADMEEAAEYIWAESPASARRWLSRCWEAIDTLTELPLRQPLIPEAEELGIPYRSVPLQAHRLIYRVDGERSVVYVVRIYHDARRPLTDRDIQPI